MASEENKDEEFFYFPTKEPFFFPVFSKFPFFPSFFHFFSNFLILFCNERKVRHFSIRDLFFGNGFLRNTGAQEFENTQGPIFSRLG